MKKTLSLRHYFQRTPIKVVLIYVIVSVLWITLSDHILYRVIRDYRALEILSTFKGWFFIAVTAVLLYSLIRSDLMTIGKAEESRKESEQTYKELSDSIGDIFFALDRDLCYTYWNRASALFTGISSEDTIGQYVYEVFPNLLGTEGEAVAKKVMASGTPESFTRSFRMKGVSYVFDISIYPSRSGLSVFVKDITESKRVEERLKENATKAHDILEGTVRVLGSVAEKRDPYIAGHQQRSSRLAVAIAREMGLPENDIEAIRVAGLLHDIGKISIPAEILNKAGPLSENEFQIVKLYPQISYDILKEIPFQWPVADLALQHQEKINGSGYPAGLSGDGIMLGARILAVADYIDAMSSHRPYRPTQGIDKALEEIQLYRGVLYDPNVVDAALELIKNKGFTLREA